MSNNYSVRIRGREHGPFGLAKMRELVRKGQVARMHEVSVDGMTWQAASTFSELFERGAAAAGTKSTGSGATGGVVGGAGVHAVASPPGGGTGEWYYSDGEGSQGPHTLAEIERLAAKGVIRAEDHVWDPRKGEWVQASMVTSVSGSGPGNHATTSESASDHSAVGMPLLGSTLKSMAGWKLFIALWCLVMGVLTIIGGLALLSRSDGEGPLVGGAVSTLFSGVYLSIIGGLLLSAYSAVTAAAARPIEEVISAAIRAENRVWMAVSIALLFTTLGAIVVAIAASNPRF